MTRSGFLFYVIDVCFHPFQNYRRYKGMIREKDFAYDPSRPDDCKMEYYYNPELLEDAKKNGKKLPVVLNIHGGGFVKGDKKHRHSLCKRYAHNGYFVVNINYGLGPKDCYPQGVIDCANALNYLEKTAEDYPIDLKRVCVTGDSAGAYCATYLTAMAYSEGLCEKIGAPEIKVKPAVLASFCGPYDLVTSITTVKLPFGLLWDIGRCFLGFEFGLKKDYSNIYDYPYINEICPSNLVNSNWCPTFLVMSKKDIFCKGQGEILEKLLKDANVEVESFSSEKMMDNHCFHLDMYKKISENCYKQVFAFLDKHLKGESAAEVAPAEEAVIEEVAAAADAE